LLLLPLLIKLQLFLQQKKGLNSRECKQGQERELLLPRLKPLFNLQSRLLRKEPGIQEPLFLIHQLSTLQPLEDKQLRFKFLSKLRLELLQLREKLQPPRGILPLIKRPLSFLKVPRA
jgi:hypothetical protein